MKKVILFLLLIIPSLVFAQEPQQQAPQKVSDFRKTLKPIKGNTPEDAMAYNEEKKKWKRIDRNKDNMLTRRENAIYLNEQMEGDTKLSPADRYVLIKYFQSQYDGDISLSDEQQGENVAFFKRIANDPNLTLEQKTAAIDEHFKKIE